MLGATMQNHSKRRPPVVRAERILPTPETLARARGCIIDKLYRAQIIDGLEQEAAWEILEAFKIITGFMGIRPMLLDGLPKGRGGLSPRAAHLWDHYVAWGNSLVARRYIRPHVIVEWLEMDRELHFRSETKLLKKCLQDWRVVDFPKR